MHGFDPEIAAAQTASAAAHSRHELAVSPSLCRHPLCDGTLPQVGLRALPLRSGQLPPARLARNAPTINGRKGRKNRRVFRRVAPFFSKKSGDFFASSPNNRKKAFHPAPKSGETLSFMRCPRNLACGGGAQRTRRRTVQPSTHCATACATPSSSLESVTRSATAFTSSAALAIATPMPAKRNMARSLKPSPNAMSCSRDKPR